MSFKGTDRKVSFVLEPLVPTESSQDKENFPVRSHPEEIILSGNQP